MQEILGLANKYNVRAPRYTSYPTAADFHAPFDASNRDEAIKRTNADPVPAPLALYLHLPFCRSLCYYCACNKVVTHNDGKTQQYLNQLAIEASRVAPLLAPDRQVSHIHLGGGTPTYYTPAQLGELIASLGNTFRLKPPGAAEWSIEIDPRTVTPGDIGNLRRLGFNRLSLGVQDLHPQVQAAINRKLAPERLQELMDAAREAGFDSINFDLIYGLPHQNEKRFEHTLQQVIQMGPDRLALFAYAHLPDRFRAQRLLEGDALPDGQERLKLLHRAIAAFRHAGYEYIGMDHFARPDDLLARSRRDGTLVRNFQGYCPGPDTDLIGLGASAISSLDDVYCQNTRPVREWGDKVETGRPTVDRGYRLSEEDRLRRDVIGAIMCRDVVLHSDFDKYCDNGFAHHFRRELDRLQPLAQDGLVRCLDDRMEITHLGRLFLRAIAMVFDTYLPKPGAANQPTFSRIV